MGYILIKGESLDYIYSVDYRSLDEVEEEYCDFFSSSRWTHIASDADIHLFRAYPGTNLMYSDRETTIEKHNSLIASMTHFIIPLVLITVLAWIGVMLSSGILDSKMSILNFKNRLLEEKIMNKVAINYWNAYWKEQKKPRSVCAWQFGANPDTLAQLVIDGKKTASCSGYLFYELENEPIPTTGDYSVILNSKNQPVAIIKTTQVDVMPMNEVPEDFAIAEGEDDRTYQYWWDAHEAFLEMN